MEARLLWEQEGFGSTPRRPTGEDRGVRDEGRELLLIPRSSSLKR